MSEKRKSLNDAIEDGTATYAEVLKSRNVWRNGAEANEKHIANLEREVARLTREEAILRSRHNGEVCVEVQDAYEQIKRENTDLRQKVSDAEKVASVATPREWERICISIDYPDDSPSSIRYTIGSSDTNPFGWGETLWEAFAMAASHGEVIDALEAMKSDREVKG